MSKKTENKPLTMEQMLQMECEGIQYDEAVRSTDDVAAAMLAFAPGQEPEREPEREPEPEPAAIWLPVRCPLHPKGEDWRFSIHREMIIPGSPSHQFDVVLGCARSHGQDGTEYGPHAVTVNREQVTALIEARRAGDTRKLTNMIRALMRGGRKHPRT
jgi:hypothetical protein